MNYITCRKIINYIKYKIDTKYKRIITSSFPPLISFQSSAYCNTSCRLCPVGLEMKGVEKGFLEFGKFKQVIDEAKKYLMGIHFGDWGEPFLNPDIFDMIKYAEDNKIMTAVSTNLHQFKNEDDLFNLLDCGLSFLTISLHGVTQETYETYQPNKSFEETDKKIKTLISLKKKLGKKKPVIDLAFVITKKNQHEIKKMRQFTKYLGVDCRMYTASLNLRFYLDDDKKIVRLIKEWAQDDKYDLCDNVRRGRRGKSKIKKIYETILKEQKVDFDSLDEQGLTSRHFCSDPWTSLVVNWNGTVSLCCVDYSKYVMGDISKESMTVIWNNAEYINLRKYLRNQTLDIHMNHPCRNCIRY